MNGSTRVLSVLVRAFGAAALVLGLAFWLGYARSLTQLHIWLGIGFGAMRVGGVVGRVEAHEARRARRARCDVLCHQLGLRRHAGRGTAGRVSLGHRSRPSRSGTEHCRGGSPAGAAVSHGESRQRRRSHSEWRLRREPVRDTID